MSIISRISSETPLQEYAVGAVQINTRKVGEFLAPSVPTPTLLGRYKAWDEKSRFYVPQTIRSLSGPAVEIGSSASDKDFECTPNGLNYTVDKSLGEDTDRIVKDGVDFLADIWGLAHLYETVSKAKAAVGAGTDVHYDGAVDPIDLIDTQINAVLLAGKCEMAGVLIGALAWQRLKNHPLVAARRQVLNYDSNPSLFTADAEYMGCWAFIDEAAEGLAADIQFLLQDEILIFGRHPVPQRRDPSFMKTFRVDGFVETVKITPTNDGRRLIVTSDWAAAIEVTNSAAASRINYLSA